MCTEDHQEHRWDPVGNWRRSNRPFGVKLGMAIKNNLKKAATLSDCCGNYGEPGC